MSAKPKAPQSAAQLLKVAGATSDLRGAVISHQAPPPPASPKALPPGSVDVVNTLFKELQAIFPAWKQAWPDTESLRTAKRSWIKAFIAEGINQLEQIRYGVERCRSLGTDFAPSVGKFIKLCQPTPEMLGIPPHDKAFREALVNAHPSRFGSRVWSHPAIRHAALQCELHNLGDLAPDKACAIFDRAYDVTIRLLVQGKALEDIAIGIGYDGQKTEAELADEHGQWRQQQIMARQAIPANGQDARRALLARFGLGLEHD